MTKRTSSSAPPTAIEAIACAVARAWGAGPSTAVKLTATRTTSRRWLVEGRHPSTPRHPKGYVFFRSAQLDLDIERAREDAAEGVGIGPEFEALVLHLMSNEEEARMGRLLRAAADAGTL